MRKWTDISPDAGILQLFGNTQTQVAGVAFDSRKVMRNFVFVAQAGTHTDGHQFIYLAIEKGASVIVCEKLPETLDEKVLYVEVADSAEALGQIASAWYGHPSQKLKVVGVTGTNGKTSIATLSYQLFMQLGYQAGLVSTISANVGIVAETASHTTPDALKLQSLFAAMVDAGCEYCFMEVSSHAVVQRRIVGVNFSGAIFTNITHDHLDYHKTFAEYLKAKKTFFDNHLSKQAFALINIDDKNGKVMVQNCVARVATYSVRSMADFRCKVLETHFNGMLLDFDGQEVWTHFVGKFNASNLLAVYGAAILLGQSKDEVLSVISRLTPVPGRFETIRSLNGILAIVDYAHTPDALKNVLSAISEIRSPDQKVITVVGAGGDRDKTKRPEMAKESLATSDLVILTSDNPRTEEPEAIIRDMETGVDKTDSARTISITNRREAIKTAVHMARPGDIILIAGKGHENYQEVNGVKHHFDDKEVVKEFFGIE
ncbi:MAG: UDP-N-acetylmuramoyl-L-alanyl-D-glutamate--2,6-diaminopimelate ligase [Prolixibacteraceae bacterium]|nr:UDP-N-acetylmuramoyl-L-alanyl-D-glutamate--2,6-diaminopimelate ligase [Prolixibacteraceae bacterium]